MSEKTALIPAISCGHCKMTIMNEIGEMEGVIVSNVNVEEKTATFAWEDEVQWTDIEKLLVEIGFPPAS